MFIAPVCISPVPAMPIVASAALIKARPGRTVLPAADRAFADLFETLQADTAELQEQCFRLRAEAGGAQLARDVFDAHAVHALLRHRASGAWIGTLRIILHRGAAGAGFFPVHRLALQHGVTLPDQIAARHVGELSCLAIPAGAARLAAASWQAAVPGAGAPPLVTGLLGAAYRLSREQDVRAWLCVLPPALLRKLALQHLVPQAPGALGQAKGAWQINYVTLRAIDELARQRPELWSLLTAQGAYSQIRPRIIPATV